MYLASVLLFMLVLPVLSVLVEGLALHSSLALFVLIAHWFIFWAMGIRLFTAGASQALNPRFTATNIFHFKSDEPLFVIRELGFANLALGTIGILSLFQTVWLFPAVVAGTVFYGLAGINHLSQPPQSRNETVALITDLFAFAVLLLCTVGLLLTAHPFAALP